MANEETVKQPKPSAKVVGVTPKAISIIGELTDINSIDGQGFTILSITDVNGQIHDVRTSDNNWTTRNAERIHVGDVVNTSYNENIADTTMYTDKEGIDHLHQSSHNLMVKIGLGSRSIFNAHLNASMKSFEKQASYDKFGKSLMKELEQASDDNKSALAGMFGAFMS